MKKILALLLALAMVLSFAACSKSGKCDNCGKKTSNYLEIAGEGGYACDECCEEQFGMSFEEVKKMTESAASMAEDLGGLAE